MQSRYSHELDHMRNASQWPSPSKSLDHSTPNPSNPSSPRTHSRTQSTITNNREHVYSSPKAKTTYFDRNDGGWLESSPIQLSASTSHSSPSQHSQHTHNEPNSSEEGCTKDMLGTISNDDILKLTQLTNKLPMVSTKHNHIQKGHSQTRHQQYLVEDELLQQHDEPSDINDSRHIDTGVTNLLNQEFMRSSPVSDTDYSALLTIPSTISTDTEDNHFSWHDTNRFAKQPPLLRKTLSEQTTATAAATAAKMRSYHPLTISTTAPYTEVDLTPSSSQTSRQSKRRSWYKSLMKRDKKGKTKYTDSPIFDHDEPTAALGPDDDTDDPPSSIYRSLQHELNPDHHHLRSRTHPMLDMTANDMTPPIPPPSSSDSSTRKQRSMHRFRFPTRRKRRSSSFGIQDAPSSTDKTATTTEDDQQRHRLYGRRHSFDNIRDYELPSHGTNSPVLDMTTTTGQKEGKHYLNNRDILSTGTTTSQLSSAPSIASTISLLSASSPPHIPSSNIPPPSQTNGNDSPRYLSSSSPGTPKLDIDELELDDDDDTDGSIIDHNHHPPMIEITPVLSQQHQQRDNHPHHTQKTFYFDYDSLPWENRCGEPQGAKALVKKMIDNGYGMVTETQIKLDHDTDDDESSSDDDDLASKMASVVEDQDTGDTELNDKKAHDTTMPTIESSKIIGGDAYYAWLDKLRFSNAKSGTRRLAEIHVGAENDTGFFKLTQLAEETMLNKGRLLNLYVSFLVPDKAEDDIASHLQETSMLDKSINDRLLSLDPFIDDAQVFLNERTQQYRAFVPMDNPINTTRQQQSRQNHGSRKNPDSSSETCLRHHHHPNTSSCSLSSFSSVASIFPSSTSKPQQSSTTISPPPQQPSSSHGNGSSTLLQSLWNCVPYHGFNAYDYRQEQLRDAISDLQRGMEEFKRSLKDTEQMVHGVQIDMNDTKAEMDTYLKDVPETHYSELKRLEVSIESILANRAKSRGMELLYWLLTALLTGCAFLLWAVICVLKLGQTAISFPGKMIKAFNDHMEERNKVVKQAGRRIVTKGAERSPPSSSSLDSPRSLSHAPTLSIADDIPTGSSRCRSSSSRRASIPK